MGYNREDMGERLSKLQNKYSRSVNEFSLKIGKNPVTMNNYLKGERDVTIDVLVGIATIFPEVNFRWLLLGEGEMILKEKPVPSGDGKTADVSMQYIESLMLENRELHKQVMAMMDKYQALMDKFLNSITNDNKVE